MPPSRRAPPTPRNSDKHGGHPAPASALPASGQRARRGHRDGDALDRRRGGPGFDRVGLSGLPGPSRRERAAGLARVRGAAVGAAARDARDGARAGWSVHRRAPGVPRSVPRENGAVRGDDRRHEPGARRLVPRRAHRRRDRRRGRRSRVDAHARRDPGPLRQERRARRGLGARERRALPSRQSLLGRRSCRLRAALRPERDRMGRAAPPPRFRARGRGPRLRSPRRFPRSARGARRGCPRPLPLGLHRGAPRLPQGGRPGDTAQRAGAQDPAGPD